MSSLSTLLTHKKQYSCLMYEFPFWMAQRIIEWGVDHIPNDALYEEKEDPSYGRELKIHCTIFFGIHTNDGELVKTLLCDEEAFSIKLGKTSYFENCKFDVVKIDVEGGNLYRLHDKIKTQLETTDPYPNYCPHVTIAYVKKGFGPLFNNYNDFEGQTLWINSLKFSNCLGEINHICLKKRQPVDVYSHN